ncbi:hypothetical protein J2S43_000101 [Catenuloplanes nepalensis]|uniref:Uncharacterized protein n=1 Tax=Catenuloplanes nepalensis TaxID=587533 RepID=A0ABT9MJI5_9ACTN|nr:hypothetical protein [Catenuloplanes nepalensis]MDP9791589.1 hypothetical protein [Catenuloplanes nepalensis]
MWRIAYPPYRDRPPRPDEAPYPDRLRAPEHAGIRHPRRDAAPPRPGDRPAG